MASNDKAGVKTINIFSLVVTVVGGWSLFLLGLAIYWSQAKEPQAGSFGDAFGILNSLFAGLASVFTYAAFQNTRQEAALLQRREQRRAAEDRFYRLMDSRGELTRSIRLSAATVSHLRAGGPGEELEGALALREMAHALRIAVILEEISLEKAWKRLFDACDDQLGNYFRLTYRIVRLAEEELGAEAYSHLSMLRAHMSSSELLLLACNCAVGRGRPRFHAFVESYSLLDEMDKEDRSEFRLDEYYSPVAFGASVSQGVHA